MAFFLERLGYGHGHGLLLWPKLKILRLRKDAVGSENRSDLIDQCRSDGFLKGNHTNEEIRRNIPVALATLVKHQAGFKAPSTKPPPKAEAPNPKLQRITNHQTSNYHWALWHVGDSGLGLLW